MKNRLLVIFFSTVLIASCRKAPCPNGEEFKGTGMITDGIQWCGYTDTDGKSVREGAYIKWHSPTQKKLEGFYKNNKRDGKWVSWYPEGQKKDQGHWRDGLANGEWSYWFPDGRRHKHGYRNRGISTGKWTTWYPNGKIKDVRHYDNGVKTGEWRRFREDGSLIEKGQYRKDTKAGKWQYWNTNREKPRVVVYDFPADLRNNLPSALPSNAPRPQGRNVLVIVVDALRADGLNSYGYDKPTSPAAGDLAAEGIVFENAHAASPWTAPSFATMLTGVSPSVHRVGWRLFRDNPAIKPDETMSVGSVRITRLSDGVPTIASLLKPKKMKTGAIVNNAFLHPDTGLSADFDYYDLVIPYERKEAKYKAVDGIMRNADEVTTAAITWLSEQKEAPFFLLLHYFDPHVSYEAPKKYREQFATFNTSRFKNEFSDVVKIRSGKMQVSPTEEKQIRGHYDAEVRFTDDEIGRLLSSMKARGLLENTWIVFTADHGEEVFDHGYTDHGHRYEEEVTRIPFIIRAPGGKWNAGVRIPASVRHIDLVPTLLDILELEPPAVVEGKSVFSLLTGKEKQPRPAYMEYNLYWGQQYAWYDGSRYKLIAPVDLPAGAPAGPPGDQGNGGAFMYDLRTDPGEHTKLAGTHPMFDTLQTAARNHRMMLKQRAALYTHEATNVALSKEVEASLKALGYLDE